MLEQIRSMTMRTVNVLVACILIVPVAQRLIILPVPGTGAQELTPEEAIEIADTSYTRDDARFMRT